MISEIGRARPLAFLSVLLCGAAVLAALVVRDSWDDPRSRQRSLDTTRVAEVLGITDLALWTEARYTRHPSQADWFSAFQSGPAAPDHFSSGTWAPPPRPPLSSGDNRIKDR